jgi:hypothetical protein
MPCFFIDEPSLQLTSLLRDALAARGCEAREAGAWPHLDASAFLHDEAGLLDADELREAEAALMEDGIFSASSLEAVASSLDVDTEAALRAAVKYGWVLAVAQQSAQGPFDLSVEAGTERTSTLEHRFLISEIERRGLEVHSLALCTPGQLEPAIEPVDEAAQFKAWLVEHEGIDGPSLAFANMEMKWDLLPAIARHAPRSHCGLNRVAWLGTLRVVARRDPELFREMLSEAQVRFAMEKGDRISATTEDDIRSLPLVEDALLETTFLDDFRGRQLLYVAAPALAGDARLAALLDRERDAVAALIGATADRYAGAIRV